VLIFDQHLLQAFRFQRIAEACKNQQQMGVTLGGLRAARFPPKLVGNRRPFYYSQ
jgi:hypothetical protein